MNRPVAAVEVERLSFRYPDGTQALNAASLTIREGEKVALMGPNGAGKSTLLLHLNGLLQGEGRVLVLGRPRRPVGPALEPLEPRNLKSIRRKVGLVFQNPDDQLFCPNLYDDVAFGPRNLGLAEEEVRARVGRSLAAVGLSGLDGRMAYHLSWGEKRRAAIATVLALGAEILALDEPTAYLDAAGRRDLVRCLKRIGGTQILATHSFGLVEELCERVVVMVEGRVVAEGTPEAIRSQRDAAERYGLA